MTITREYDTMLIGKDFAEAVSGPYRSHGEIQVQGGKKFTFFSTLGCSDSSDALIQAAKKEGQRLANIMTQSFSEWRDRNKDGSTSASRPF